MKLLCLSWSRIKDGTWRFKKTDSTQSRRSARIQQLFGKSGTEYSVLDRSPRALTTSYSLSGAGQVDRIPPSSIREILVVDYQKERIRGAVHDTISYDIVDGFRQYYSN